MTATPRRCRVCTRKLRSDNRSGYCRAHHPYGGAVFAWQRCDCGALLSRGCVKTRKCRSCNGRAFAARAGRDARGRVTAPNAGAPR